jgi:hypothetical protein
MFTKPSMGLPPGGSYLLRGKQRPQLVAGRVHDRSGEVTAEGNRLFFLVIIICIRPRSVMVVEKCRS